MGEEQALIAVSKVNDCGLNDEGSFLDRDIMMFRITTVSEPPLKYTQPPT